MQAGSSRFLLPLPHRGSSYERVGAVFADTSPAVVLTTCAAAEDVGDYVDQSRMDTAPKIVAIDALNLDVEAGLAFRQPIHRTSPTCSTARVRLACPPGS